jgi:hypothetical protein
MNEDCHPMPPTPPLTAVPDHPLSPGAARRTGAA